MLVLVNKKSPAITSGFPSGAEEMKNFSSHGDVALLICAPTRREHLGEATYMEVKNTTTKNDSERHARLHRKLERHFLTASAALGTAAALAPSDANATIQYFDPADIQITLSSTAGIYFNLQTGATGSSAAAVPGWDFNIFNPSAGTLLTYTVGAPGSGLVGYTSGGYQYSSRLSNGASIGPASTFVGIGGITTMSYGNTYGQWTGNTTGFLGVTFTLADSSVVFGWIEVNVVNGGDARVTRWAWEDNGGAIAAGAVPEPSSLALSFLAAGAAGLAYWRKRKANKSAEV